MRPKISLITLGVADLDRSLTFYRDGLGWRPSKAGNENVAFIPLGGVVLGLYPRHLLADDVGVSAGGDGFAGITLAHNVRSVEEVDEIFAMLKRIGATIMKPPQKVFWGGYSGYFADPDGHLWEVAHNPFWSFDAQDNVVLE